jgi:hypothetical protein
MLIFVASFVEEKINTVKLEDCNALDVALNTPSDGRLVRLKWRL